MSGVSRIQITMIGKDGHIVERLQIGTGGDEPLRFGDEVEVAFPDTSSKHAFRLRWQRMRVTEMDELGMVAVADLGEISYWVDISRVRRL